MDNILYFVFFFLFMAAASVVLVFFNYLQGNKYRGKLKNLAEHFPGSVPKFSFYPRFDGRYQGLDFKVVFIPAKEYGRGKRPDQISITFQKRSSLKLNIYEESFFSKLGEKVGAVKEVKTGDEAFDKTFLLFSNNHNQAQIFLSGSDIKESIQFLFKQGFKNIKINGKTVHAQMGYMKGYLRVAYIPKYVESLGLLASALT
jgi:hypothetical protein